VTGFVAIIATNLRQIFGRKEPPNRRIPRYTFNQGIGHCN